MDTNLHQPGEIKWSERVQQTLRSMPSFESSDANLAQVCQALGVSKRTLQRRLKEEGLIFYSILDAERKNLALRLLAESDRPIEEIAATIGFVEVASFYRAMRRWIGKTPTKFRS